MKGHEHNDSARHEFVSLNSDYELQYDLTDVVYGVMGVVSRDKDGLTPNTFYIDNLKAYMVDEFKVKNVTGNSNVFNIKTGKVVYEFTKPVAPSTKDNVVLLDKDGNEVTNGIKSVTLSEADTVMTVMLNEKAVSGLTEYRIKLTEDLRDIDGLTLSTEWKYFEYDVDKYYEKAEGKENVYIVTEVDGKETDAIEMTYTPRTETTPAFLTYTDAKGKSYQTRVDTWVRDTDAMKMLVSLKTSKSSGVYADAESALISGNAITSNVSITNPEADAKAVWCVIAAYGEYDRMIGHQIVFDGELAAGEAVSLPVSFTTENSNVEKVKMFLWNSKKDMVTYQPAEDIKK